MAGPTVILRRTKLVLPHDYCSYNSCLPVVLLYFYSSYLSRLTAMLVDGLLWSDVGQSLLKVVGIGIEVVDKLFTVYGR